MALLSCYHVQAVTLVKGHPAAHSQDVETSVQRKAVDNIKNTEENIRNFFFFFCFNLRPEANF